MQAFFGPGFAVRLLSAAYVPMPLPADLPGQLRRTSPRPPPPPPDRSRLRVASRSFTFGRQCVRPAALGSHVLKPGLGAADFVARLRARRQVAFRSGIQVFALGGLAHTDAVGRRHLQAVSRILVGWCRFPGRLGCYFGSTGSGVRAVDRWHCGAPASLPLRAKAGFVAVLASTDLWYCVSGTFAGGRMQGV